MIQPCSFLMDLSQTNADRNFIVGLQEKMNMETHFKGLEPWIPDFFDFFL